MAVTKEPKQSMMYDMQKSTVGIVKWMSGSNVRNSSNYKQMALYLKTMGGTYNLMGQWADLMSKFYSGMTK